MKQIIASMKQIIALVFSEIYLILLGILIVNYFNNYNCKRIQTSLAEVNFLSRNETNYSCYITYNLLRLVIITFLISSE